VIVVPYKMILPWDDRFGWESCPFEEEVVSNCRRISVSYGKHASTRIKVASPDNQQLHQLKRLFGRPHRDDESYVVLWSNDVVWLQRELRLLAQPWTEPTEPEVLWKWIRRNYQRATP